MIIALEEAKRQLIAMEDTLAELKNQLKIEEAAERAAELERETTVGSFWDDAERSSKILKEMKGLQEKVELQRSLLEA